MKHLSTSFALFLALFGSSLAFAQRTDLEASLFGDHTYESFYTIDVDVDEAFSLLEWTREEDPDYTPPEAYQRSRHFSPWITDPSRQSCLDVRGLVLVRHALAPVTIDPKNRCRVFSSTWYDPYSDEYFRKAADLQIDHVVPLKNAYLAGAWSWSYEKRCHYSNFMGDTSHLIPIQKYANLSKGDRGPDAYLPVNSQYQCQYVAAWLKIKAVWQLKIALPEAKAIKAFLSENSCQEELFEMSAEEYNSLHAQAEEPPPACSLIQQIEADAMAD